MQIRLLLTYIQKQINPSYRHNQYIRQLTLFFGTLILILGNSKLLLATLSGIGIMFLIYRWDELNWQQYWIQYIKILKGSQKRFTLAVASGGVIAVTTYMVAEIWTETENTWLATSAILQGLFTVITLGLLSWQFYHQKSYHQESETEYFLKNLTAKSSLKRLIAVRYFANLINEKSLTVIEKNQIEEYFLLMLKIESEPTIKEVLQESLLFINPQKYLKKVNLMAKKQSLQIPIKIHN